MPIQMPGYASEKDVVGCSDDCQRYSGMVEYGMYLLRRRKAGILVT